LEKLIPYLITINKAQIEVRKSDSFGLPSCTGFGMYHLYAFLNHSCEPNATITFKPYSHSAFSVITKEHIPKGTELLVSYFNPNVPVFNRRRNSQNNYGFRCFCTKCLLETKCLQCEDIESSLKVHSACDNCRTSWYCSTKCQKAHWKEHKRECKDKKWEKHKIIMVI